MKPLAISIEPVMRISAGRVHDERDYRVVLFRGEDKIATFEESFDSKTAAVDNFLTVGEMIAQQFLDREQAATETLAPTA